MIDWRGGVAVKSFPLLALIVLISKSTKQSQHTKFLYNISSPEELSPLIQSETKL